jgi:hypothetical protein
LTAKNQFSCNLSSISRLISVDANVSVAAVVGAVVAAVGAARAHVARSQDEEDEIGGGILIIITSRAI